MSPNVDTTQAAIGVEIRRVRARMGMTLQEFAQHVGLPWQTLQAYETGRSVPPADKLFKITHATRRVSEPFRFEYVAKAVVGALRAA